MPSLTGQHPSNPFCRACQTNQTLLINLRAAYLPEPEDPSYSSRLAQLPTYVASLQTRYPSVCASCLPAVEAEIARKDEFARTRALGAALKASSRPPSRTDGPKTSAKLSRVKIRTWKIRGALWTITLCAALGVNAAGKCDEYNYITLFMHPTLETFKLNTPKPFVTISPVLPLFILLSLAWTFWDPTFSLQQKSRLQGKQVRIGGRQRYIVSISNHKN